MEYQPKQTPEQPGEQSVEQFLGSDHEALTPYDENIVEDLANKFNFDPNNVAVRRSSGDIEDGWSLNSVYDVKNEDGSFRFTAGVVSKPYLDEAGNVMRDESGKGLTLFKNIEINELVDRQKEFNQTESDTQNLEDEVQQNPAEDWISAQIKELEEGNGKQILVELGQSDKEADKNSNTEHEKESIESVNDIDEKVKEVLSDKNNVADILLSETKPEIDLDKTVLSQIKNELTRAYRLFSQNESMAESKNIINERITEVEQLLETKLNILSEQTGIVNAAERNLEEVDSQLQRYLNRFEGARSVDVDEAEFVIRKFKSTVDELLHSPSLRQLNDLEYSAVLQTAMQYQEDIENSVRDAAHAEDSQAELHNPDMVEKFAEQIAESGDIYRFIQDVSEGIDENSVNVRGKADYAEHLALDLRKASHFRDELVGLNLQNRLDDIDRMLSSALNEIRYDDGGHISRKLKIADLYAHAPRFREARDIINQLRFAHQNIVKS